jgi:hypothetical protein
MKTLRSTWRMVGVTTLLSLFCMGATFLALRAAAQTSAKPAPAQAAPAQAPPAASAQDKAEPADAPRPEESPDLRESADNNVSFPVDI